MKKTSPRALSRKLGIRRVRGLEAVIKAELIAAVIAVAKKRGITHTELARRSAIPRSAVTGILSGSLQRVTLDRVLRLVDALDLTAEIKVKDAA